MVKFRKIGVIINKGGWLWGVWGRWRLGRWWFWALEVWEDGGFGSWRLGEVSGVGGCGFGGLKIGGRFRD